MKKSNKKRDQKRSAKARKQLHDKVGAQKQQEMYEAGSLRSVERERERMRQRRNQPNLFAAAYGGAAMQAAAMEGLLASMEREDEQRRQMRDMFDGIGMDTLFGGRR